MDVFGKICAAIILVYLVVLNPLQYIYEINHGYKSSYIDTRCLEFVNQVLSSGRFTLDDYQELKERLEQTGDVFEISLLHTHPVSGSIGKEEMESMLYPVPPLENECEEEKTRVLHEIKANMITTTVEKYSELPIQNLVLIYTDGTSEIVMDGWVVEGYQYDQAGEYQVKIQYTKDGITKDTFVLVRVTNLMTTCMYCNEEYEMNDDDTAGSCPNCSKVIHYIEVDRKYIEVEKGEPLSLLVTAVFEDGHREYIKDWTSNYDPEKIGLQIIYIQYQEYQVRVEVNVRNHKTCPICKKSLPDDVEDFSCPYCREELVEITVLPTHQEVNYGENPKINVIGCYRDGHKDELIEYTSDFDPYRIGTQIVQISHGPITAQIQVDVCPTMEVCSICKRVYSQEQSMMGCPYCSKEMIGIEAYLVSDGDKVQLGSDLNLRIVIIYQDLSRVLKFSGYTYENYDKNVLGKQRVTVHYQGKQAMLDIEVVNTLTKNVCAKGHVYFLGGDGNNWSCPYCNGMYGDLEKTYTIIKTTEEILEELSREGEYLITSGDSFTVKVENKSQKSSILCKIAPTNLLLQERRYTYGGIVE